MEKMFVLVLQPVACICRLGCLFIGAKSSGYIAFNTFVYSMFEKFALKIWSTIIY